MRSSNLIFMKHPGVRRGIGGVQPLWATIFVAFIRGSLLHCRRIKCWSRGVTLIYAEQLSLFVFSGVQSYVYILTTSEVSLQEYAQSSCLILISRIV